METSPAKPRFLDGLTAVFDERSFRRYLGYPRGTTPDDRVQETLQKQKKLLPDLLKPRGIYACFSGQACFNQDFPLYERDVILCVVTIGGKLEARAAEYAARGDVLAGFVLDTLGSVYAEGIAEAAYLRLAELGREAGVQIGCRISPGYGNWPLTYQEKIFALLPVEQIGVRLTSRLMMVPRKSVSFAAERSADPMRIREGDQCEDCRMGDCRYRHKGTKPSKKNANP